MYRNLTNCWNPGTKTLEIHQGETGWYFTVHKNNTLLFLSPTYQDRVETTQHGMKYLDNLREIDYALQKG